MLDLAAWLLEQISEDERLARVVGDDRLRWEFGEFSDAVTVADTNDYVACGPWQGTIGGNDARHIVNVDPARVLAECEAKRRIVELYRFVDLSTPVTEVRPPDSAAAVAALLNVLQEFGATYAKAGRTGYREEWQPMGESWAEPFTDT